MLWTIIVILIVLWLLGFIGHVGGSLIHLLLVIAVVILIINLLRGRRGLWTNALPNCCRSRSAERATIESQPTGKELSHGFDRYLNPAAAGLCDRSKNRMFSPMALVSSKDEKRYCLICGEIITRLGKSRWLSAHVTTGYCAHLSDETLWCDADRMGVATDGVLITIAMIEAEQNWLRLIMRAGRAMQSYRSKTTSSTISRTRSRPPSGSVSKQKTEARGCEVPCDSWA